MQKCACNEQLQLKGDNLLNLTCTDKPIAKLIVSPSEIDHHKSYGSKLHHLVNVATLKTLEHR